MEWLYGKAWTPLGLGLIAVALVIALELEAELGWVITALLAFAAVVASVAYKFGLDADLRASPVSALSERIEIWWPFVRYLRGLLIGAGGAWLALSTTTGTIGEWLPWKFPEKSAEAAALGSLVGLVAGYLTKTYVEGIQAPDQEIAARAFKDFNRVFSEHVAEAWAAENESGAPSQETMDVYVLVVDSESDWSDSTTRANNGTTIATWLESHPFPDPAP